jgi:hypothetical protein
LSPLTAMLPPEQLFVLHRGVSAMFSGGKGRLVAGEPGGGYSHVKVARIAERLHGADRVGERAVGVELELIYGGRSAAGRARVCGVRD